MKLLVGTPALDCRVHLNYAASLANLAEYCQRSYIAMDLRLMGHDSIISKARNTIMHYALTQGNYTHLLMIDADMGWPWEALELLKDADRPVISALCPLKKYPLEYALQPLQGELPDHKGVQKVDRASTAFMLLRLKYFEEKIDKVPRFKCVSSLTGKLEEMWDFFPAGISEDGWFVGEDVGFSMLLRDLEISSYIHTKVKTTHSGNHVFREGGSL